ncbi:copper amine oxidase N-terminal domain-containing protein [Paenibacillus sp. Cedars]|uniref:copper amine oxidase N-terminal domain-containing protein n=1 Tax=Paenibacillus sp. Cedars TaxID=1980674 RepID=UPI0011623F23|nr:copper amine oxidase N-terminal domain-containing protein [Paenibacillus sp. Cedars]AWP29278.1 copper amine oxidase [Paenibacillus sp. Cedars]
MKRIWTALLAAILLIPMTFQTQAQAAVNISVLIDGVKLYTPQAPVMIQGRVMLPMRSIFEALDATVKWNQKTQTVTAVKDGTTVILKINSKTATINNQTVALDVPAKNLKGNTMVPVRFVSESLGQKIGWNSKTKTVTVTTTNDSGGGNNTYIVPVSYVTQKDIGNAGDGRDLQVSFSKSSTESLISHYRVMIVKQSKTFSQADATRISSANYTTVYPAGSDRSQVLTSSSRDIDGDLIRDNQAYKAYVLAVGKSGGTYALSSASPSLTLTNTNSVNGATNVKASDISDNGDGRDLQVSFTRAQNESNVTNYRVFTVKTKDAANFNVAAAKSVSSQNYTTVNKTSSTNTTLSTTLSSSARDTSGELIRSGVSYTVFVLSVSSNESALASNLSSGSASITLSTGNATVPYITQVSDIADFGDGRDLRVSFNKVSNESSINSYRVFVVKDSNYSSFNLSKANSISSYNYTHVNKTGNNINNLTLASGARDVDGATIRSGVYYRVFVMAVDNNNYNNNILSAPSNSIILSSSYNVGAVTSLSVTDVNNYNDGRDLQVSFYRPSDQSNISHYQVFVVKSSNSYFDLYRANSLNSYYYTQISKNSSSNSYMTQVLNSSSRDIDGDLIRSGVSYRVYVLSVGYSSNNNALSDYASITLGNNNQNVNPVSTPSLTVIGNNGNGSDLRVSFSPAYGESYIEHYRIFVVKSSKNLTLSQAYANRYYTIANKTGSTITRDLASTTLDSDGEPIQRGSSYRVYVLSLGNSYSNYTNALSSASAAVTIQGVTEVGAVADVTAADAGDNNNASDLKVSFKKAANETNIREYRIMVVKQANAANFKVAQANNVGINNYDSVPIGADFSNVLRPGINDVDGQPIKNMVDYQVFVLSVSNNGNNALSAPSAPIKLTGTTVTVPSNVYAGIESTNGNGSDVVVRFSPATGSINEYRIMVVPTNKKFGDSEANNVPSGNYTVVHVDSSLNQYVRNLEASTKDVNGAVIAAGQKYSVYIMVIADGTVSTSNALSDPSEMFTIPNPIQTTALTAKLDASGKLQVDFKKAVNETSIDAYRVLFVEKSQMKDFNLQKAAEAAGKEDTKATIKPTNKDISTLIDIPTKDVSGKDITADTEYAVYVYSVPTKDVKKASSAQSATPLSLPSKTLILKTGTPAPTTP